MFLQHCTELLQQFSDDTYKPRTAMWVFSNLASEYQGHLAYSCTIRRYGTLLYRANTDLAPMLQAALWQADHTPDPEDELLDNLNHSVHQQCRDHLASTSKLTEEYEKLDVRSEINRVNKKLWKAVCKLTQSVSEREGTHTPSPYTDYVKNLRRFFIVCAIAYTANDECS